MCVNNFDTSDLVNSVDQLKINQMKGALIYKGIIVLNRLKKDLPGAASAL